MDQSSKTISSKNMSPSEINKFNSIANEWWDPNGKFKPLHLLNPIRLNFIEQEAKEINQKKILDIGCGGGILSNSLSKKGGIVTAIDLAPQALAVAKKRATEDKLTINYLEQSVEEHLEDIKLKQGLTQQYDMITCMELLEHVPDPLSIIKTTAQLIKPNGYLFFSTLNRSHLSSFLSVFVAEYILNVVPKGTHDPNKFIRPSELIAMARANNLETTKINGIKFNPITESCSLTDSVFINYIICCQPSDNFESENK